MFKVTILGSSGSAPTKDRGLSSVAVSREGSIYLFDCGEGTQRQMLKYGLNISKVKAIFITHMHGDHVIGVAGLVRTLSLYKRSEPLSIFVPKGYESAAESLLKFDSAIMTYEIKVVGVKSGIVYRGDGIEVRAFKLVHSIPTYGYSFIEEGKLHFVKGKADALGIKGKKFGEIQKKGKIKIDGKLIKLSEITYPEKEKKFTYASDTRPAASTVIAARNAELLVHEATYCADLERLARERKHSTAAEAAQVAKNAKVKKLVLTHISARYRNASQIRSEAAKVFRNVEVAEDGKEYEIDRGS